MTRLHEQWMEGARRLSKVQQSSDCVCYCREVPLAGKTGKLISIYCVCTTGEIFVEITDDRITRVESFFSRHKGFPADRRRDEMPLVDTSDAFARARMMCRHWPRGNARTGVY